MRTTNQKRIGVTALTNRRIPPHKEKNFRPETKQHNFATIVVFSVRQRKCHSAVFKQVQFYWRPSGISLSFIFFSDSLVQGKLYSGYVCFSLRHRIWTAFSLSLLRVAFYKVNKAQSFKGSCFIDLRAAFLFTTAYFCLLVLLLYVTKPVNLCIFVAG